MPIARSLGDTDFVQIPYEGLLSKAYARERRKLIDPEHASLEIRPGNPEQFMKTTQALLDRPVHINLVGEADYSKETPAISPWSTRTTTW